MTRVYLDASTIIYLVEGAAPWHDLVRQRVTELLADPGSTLVTSRLARLECRVAPLRDGATVLLERYEAFFSRRRLGLIDVTASIVERATEIRARGGFRTPDAIHLASAVDADADLVLTGDQRMGRFTAVPVEVLAFRDP